MDFLDHQLVQVVQHVAQVVGLAAQPGGHVAEDGLLPQVEADHVRHIRVDRLVVGNPGAHRIADGDVAGAVGIHQARTAQRRIGAEHLGVQEVIVHAAIDHVHALQTARGAHVHHPVAHHQVLALDQLHPHLLRQEGMLEIGAVVHARRQHHHRGRGGPGRTRRAGAQRVQQQVGVVGHRLHGVSAEQLGEQPHHHLAVFQHVRHAGRHAQVVLQHVVLALALGVAGPHDVDAGNVGVHPAGHQHALHLRAELGIAIDQVARHDAGVQDGLAMVDVLDEAVQRRDPLHQPLLHARPLAGGDDARDQVEGNQALRARPALILVAIDGKGDADAAKDHLRLGLPRTHGGLRLPCQPLGIGLVMGPHVAAIERQHCVHLVKLLHLCTPPANGLLS